MSIKIEDIKPGDEVTVRLKVERTDLDDGSVLSTRVWTKLADIVTHTPAPVEFEPGDEVRMTARGARQDKATVLAAHKNRCWIEWAGCIQTLVNKDELTLIRKAAPK